MLSNLPSTIIRDGAFGLNFLITDCERSSAVFAFVKCIPDNVAVVVETVIANIYMAHTTAMINDLYIIVFTYVYLYNKFFCNENE